VDEREALRVGEPLGLGDEPPQAAASISKRRATQN
jgi:hypothetical protein